MATRTQSLTVPAKESPDKQCNCGYAPCDGTCCRLDCIVKPHFFCGQLLTDADLSALLKWSRDRFGLTRYRHGWGVVCGLDVHCDPKVPTGVIVTPGYAVDCCGDDIIICEDAKLDLKDACREDADPCADLRLQYGRVGQGTPIAPDLNRIPGGTGVETATPKAEEPRVVDIYLRYDETPSDPATALGRSSCKQVSECEYSRTRESYKLSWKLSVGTSDPLRDRAEAWRAGYEECLEVLNQFRAAFRNGFPADGVRRWLVDWIDKHPQNYMCAQRDDICNANEKTLASEGNLVNILFMMVQNCRNAYLNCGCFGCDDDAGVPLARVSLLPDNAAGGRDCRILGVDPYPPYRRPIQPECWPAPLGAVNVGRFIWHRWDEVCRGVAELGLKVKPQEVSLPTNLAELEAKLKCDPFIYCGESRIALTVGTGSNKRVVGFCSETGAPVETGPATPPTDPCPRIGLDITRQVKVGQPIECVANVTGGDPSIKPSFTWAVSAGTIKGEGPRIAVDTSNLKPGQSVVVTLRVGGYPDLCRDITREERIPIVSEGQGGKTDKITDLDAKPQMSSEDSLTNIGLIGPARAKILNDAGINTFTDLAGASVENLKEIGTGVTEDVLEKWIAEAKARTQ